MRALLLLTLLVGVAHAEPTPIPNELLVPLAGAAAHGELALVESKPDGTMKQVTLIVFVRAPAESVRALVADVGGYMRFVPNMKQSDFARDGSGQLVDTWKLELPISSFSGRDAYEIDPAPLGPIRFHSLESLASYRWDFIPVPGGTLLVQAGYADVLHANRFVRSFVKRQPAIEHGLALAAQYMLVSAVKKEAQRRAPRTPEQPPATTAEAMEALSSRGQVVVMRSERGTLADVSVLDRIYAPRSKVKAIILDVGSYVEFIAGVERSTVIERGDATTYALDMSIPIATWSTTYQERAIGDAIDGGGVDGDLRGARYRWDLQARGSETLATYRVTSPLARSSLIVRKLFEVDPSLEYGINVAFALVQVRSIRGRAEGWATK